LKHDLASAGAVAMVAAATARTAVIETAIVRIGVLP
jgi:hypothetical protein